MAGFFFFFKLSSRLRRVLCWLETLWHCLPPRVRHTFDELLESLGRDETYERILKETKEAESGWAHTHRLSQLMPSCGDPVKFRAFDFSDEDRIEVERGTLNVELGVGILYITCYGASSGSHEAACSSYLYLRVKSVVTIDSSVTIQANQFNQLVISPPILSNEPWSFHSLQVRHHQAVSSPLNPQTSL